MQPTARDPSARCSQHDPDQDAQRPVHPLQASHQIRHGRRLQRAGGAARHFPVQRSGHAQIEHCNRRLQHDEEADQAIAVGTDDPQIKRRDDQPEDERPDLAGEVGDRVDAQRVQGMSASVLRLEIQPLEN